MKTVNLRQTGERQDNILFWLNWSWCGSIRIPLDVTTKQHGQVTLQSSKPSSVAQ